MPSLLCRVGTRFCALATEHVIETMRALSIETIRGAPEVVLGIAIVRGAAVPVVDMARVLCGPTATPPGRFVAVRVGHRRVALAVGSVLGVRWLAPSSLEDVPLLFGGGSAEVIAKVGALDSELLLVLRTMSLVPEALWRTLEAGAAP